MWEKRRNNANLQNLLAIKSKTKLLYKKYEKFYVNTINSETAIAGYYIKKKVP